MDFMFYGSIKVVCIRLLSIQKDVLGMQVWQNEKTHWLKVLLVCDDISKSLASNRIQWCVGLDLLVLFQIKDLIILIKDFRFMHVSRPIVIE
jgi:hypothetical protein